jgi:hypothetical protein
MGDMTNPTVEPIPRDAAKVLIRLPRALHDRLKTVAIGQGVSVNTLVAVVLASAVGFRLPRSKRKREPVLQNWLDDMLPGASPEGAFRQAILAWYEQGEKIDSAGIELIPKSDDDREALLHALTGIQRTATKFRKQLKTLALEGEAGR